MRSRIESNDPLEGSVSNDFPLDFSRRNFRIRTVREGVLTIDPALLQKEELCIFPD